jgi:mannose-6-phosphate isomerase-like protein (cupin superfamily)
MEGAVAMKKVNIEKSFDSFTEQWSPKIVGEVNEAYVKLVKFKGEFVWHHHDNEDEMFLVVKGRMLMKLEGEDITVEEGEFIIIPRGVEHMPVAEEEAHVLLFEPRSTLNTGNVQNERTLPTLDRL